MKKQILNVISLGWFLALKQILKSSRYATTLIVFIMMLTFLNLVATSGFLVGIVEGASRAFKEQWTSDLFITKRDENAYIERSQDIEGMLSSFPGVTSYSARLLAGAKVEANWQEKRKEEDANIVSNTIAGVDPINEDQTTHLSKQIVEGEWLREGDARGIVLGSGYLQEYSRVKDLVALLYDIHPGTVVRVTVTKSSSVTDPDQALVPKEDASTKQSTTQDFIVRGIIDSKVQFVASRAYILDSELKKMLGKTDGDISEIAIKVADGVDPYTIKTPLVNNLFSENAKINTADEGAPEFLVNIRLFFSIIGTILGSVSVVVALITIFIIIYINALTRRRQIGIMKAIGVSESAIELSYIFQALFYVITGSAIALLLIFGILKPYIDAHPIDTPFALIVLVAEPFNVIVKFLLVSVVSVFAGYLPARIIVNTNTLDAILGRNK